jgi:small subunit ribosomal protein S5
MTLYKFAISTPWGDKSELSAPVVAEDMVEQVQVVPNRVQFKSRSSQLKMHALARISRTIQPHRTHAVCRIPLRSATLLRLYSTQPSPPTPPPPENTVLNADDGERLEEVEEGEGEDVMVQGGYAHQDEGLQFDNNEDYPDLMQPDPLLDLHDTVTFPPTKHFPYPSKVTVYNDPSLFLAADALTSGDSADASSRPDVDSPQEHPSRKDGDESDNPLANLPLSMQQIMRLHRYPIMMRRITQQTGKGKIHRMYSMMVVGNGDGLVGLGEGKAEEVPEAQAKALAQAVRNMDYVERFENRTIFTEMDTKLGATRIIMRPRPVGFGLRCNPNIHQVLKAAGIKDISAKVWGSRNKINVIKACFRMIQAGHSPTAMGDGIGGGARKLNKGRGVVSREEVERARGRKLVDLRTW